MDGDTRATTVADADAWYREVFSAEARRLVAAEMTKMAVPMPEKSAAHK